MKPKHHFGLSVQFFEEKCPASDLDSGKDTASLCSERKIFQATTQPKKIHSEELDSEVATHHFGRSVQFSEGKCPASDLDSGSKYPQ